MIKSYNDITILKYQEIMAAVEMNPDNEFEQWYNILTLVTDKDKDYFKFQIKFGQFKEYIKENEWIFSTKMPDEWVKTFTVKGEKFIVIQNATDWNADQFTTMSDLTKDRSQIINNLHYILASLCVKEIGEVITLTEYDRRARLFQENLCILTAYPIGFFFAVFLAKLSESTQYSLHLKEMKKALKMNQSQQMPDNFTKHGDGIMS